MNETKHVSGFLSLIGKLPWRIRRIIAGHWRQSAIKRIGWADAITPEIEGDYAPRTRQSKRRDENGAAKTVSDLIRGQTAMRWPLATHAERITDFSNEIGWGRNRAKDFYYGDERIAIRAFEQEELNNWVEFNEKEMAQ